MTDIQKHVYKFMDLNGKQSELTTDQELDPKVLCKYKVLLGPAVTHTVEPFDNDIARPVVVEPSREYDAAGAHIAALEEEIIWLKQRINKLEQANKPINNEETT